MILTLLTKHWLPLTASALVFAFFVYFSYLYHKVDSLQTELTTVSENLEVQNTRLLTLGQLQESYRVQVENYIKELKELNNSLQTALDVVHSGSEEEKNEPISDYISRVLDSLRE